MKTLKKITSLLIVVGVMLSLIGCKSDYDKFKPVGVYLVDCINEEKYEYIIEDKDTANRMWDVFYDLEIYEDAEAEMGTAYLFVKFYDEDLSEVIFTIYENGTCCLNRDYKTFYTAENGRTAYIQLCSIYESYEATSETLGNVK